MIELYVKALAIFPVKSAAGIALSSATVGPRGFRHDRRFMVVDESGLFVSQRKHPRLALVAVAIDDHALTLSAPGEPPLVVPVDYRASSLLRGGERVRVVIWNDTCDAVAVSTEADKWLSRFLGAPLRLVCMPDESLRPVDPRHSTAGDHVSFADGFPYLILSQESLDDLNGQLATPVPMDRFRPNIVVAGGAPFVEDGWRDIVIGEVPFRVVKPCARCTIPNVDQETALVGNEPMATMAKFRRVDNAVMFGQNAIASQAGIVRVGDRVTIR